jgi:hypothetical protein
LLACLGLDGLLAQTIARRSRPAGSARRSGRGGERLGHWWMTFDLGAFWWPGFLAVCAGVAAWVRRRFPVADEWQPRAIDRDRISRSAWVLAFAFFALGAIRLTSPAQHVEQLTDGRLADESPGRWCTTRRSADRVGRCCDRS